MKKHVKRHIVQQPDDPSIRIIPLTKGQNAIVDAADYDWLNQWNWFAAYARKTRTFYAARAVRVEGRPHFMYMHRQVLGLEIEDERQGDHIKNRETLNNRRSNLRIATHAQNMQHSEKGGDGISGMKGVSLIKGRFWRARIKFNNKEIHIGLFGTKQEAYAAYCDTARKLHGKFASV